MNKHNHRRYISSPKGTDIHMNTTHILTSTKFCEHGNSLVLRLALPGARLTKCDSINLHM